MLSIKKKLQQIFSCGISQCFGADYANIDPLIQSAGRTELGDYQANFSLSLSKKINRPPLDIANQIVEALKTEKIFSELTVSGPGFINIRLNTDFLNQCLEAYLLDPQFIGLKTKEPQTIIIDYGSANVAKEMHVGHLRSAVIGDSLVRIFTLLGHKVLAQNHVGDWGTQFGMLIENLLEEKIDLRTQEMGDLNLLYKKAKEKFDNNAEFAERSRERVVSLQAGDPQSLAIWQSIVTQSEFYFQAVYKQLDVLLTQDDVRGESFYNPMLPGLVEMLLQQGLAKKDKDAVIIDLPGFLNQDKEPLPFLIRKSDGAYLYATTDLAAAHFRLKELSANRIIYVTDARQKLHFQMLFAAIEKAGWLDAHHKVEHVAFGTILGEDKKPFKTRSGDVIRLIALIEEAEKRAQDIILTRHTDLSPEEIKERAHGLGIGALKYADLSNDLVKDYVFNWNQMLAFEGNTAPYLQNAYVRIQAIFRKGNIQTENLKGKINIRTSEERALALKALAFPDVIEQVAEDLRPHKLCTYLYELAAHFHHFYEVCPILNNVDSTEGESRLKLSRSIAQLLKTGLDLLGIKTLERM
jgi:arginyl-tRNA synthetase